MIKIIKKFNNEKIKIAILFVVLIAGLFLSAFEITNAAFRHEINYQGKLTDSSDVAVADGAYNMIFKLYDAAEGGNTIYTEDWNSNATSTFASTINDGTPPLTSDGYPLAFTYTHHASETTLAVGQILYNLTKKDNVNITGVNTGTDTITISKVSVNWANSDSITTRPMVKSGLFSVMVGTMDSLSSINFNQDLWLGVTIGSDNEMTPRKKLGAVPAAFEADKLDGIDSASFLRSDEPDTMSSSSASSILTVTQEGAGASAQFGDGTDYVQISSAGNIVFVDDNDGASITGPTGGILAISAGASKALNLTANAASTWQTSAGALNITAAADALNLTASGASLWKTTSGALTIESASTLTATSTGIMTFGVNDNPRMTILTDGKVGIATTTPSEMLSVTGNIMGSGNIVLYGTATSTFGGGIEIAGFKMATGASNTYVLTSDASGYATWQAAGAGSSSWTQSGNYLYSNTLTWDVGIGTATPSAKLSVTESSGELVDFTHGSTHMFTILDKWRTRFATSSVAYFGSMNDRIVDNMESDPLEWLSSNSSYTSTTTEDSIVKMGDQSLQITTGCSSEDTTVKKTISSGVWTSYERLGFWIYADKIATSTATTTQIISIEMNDTAQGLSTHDITIQAEDQWQYEEWVLPGSTYKDAVDYIQFRIDAGIVTNIYIDHIRLYNEDERAAEFFVDASGNLNLFSPNEIEFTRAVPGGSLPSMKLGSAIVEVNQPFAVNVPGDVGINYDLYFAGPGLSQITSAGPMRISAGDSNHAENLTLTTGGKGDIIIDIADSRFGLKTIGNSNLAYVNRLYPEGELELRNTLYSDMKFIDIAGYYNGTTWATTTDEINSYQGTAQTLLADTNDFFYWGCTSTDGFSRLYFDLNAVATTSLALDWEYSTGAQTWTRFQGTTTTDDTARTFTTDGNIDWTIPGDWATTTSFGGIATSTDAHYLARVSTDTTGWTTAPTAYFAGLSRFGGDFARFTTDGTDKFRIDKDGDIYVAGKIGIATANASTTAHIISTSEQLRLGQDVTKYSQFKTDSTGDLRITATGHDIEMADDNLWVCTGGSIDSSSCPAFSVSGNGNLAVEGELFVGPDTSNYLKISGTEITYTGTAKPKRSIILTAAGAIIPSTAGAAQTRVDGTNHTYYVLDFASSTDESVFWHWTMPDSYDDGTIDITYYWEAAATSSDVVWCFQAKGLTANSAEDIDSALSSAVCEVDTAQGNANDLASITESAATSNFAKGEYVTFKIFRDADNGSDTMTGDARLVKVKIEYSVSTESD